MKEPKLRFKEGNGMQFPDWEKSKYSDVFDNINNSTFSRDCLNYVDGNVKYIHYGDILTSFDSTVNVETSNVPYVNKDKDCQKYQLLADGDIIVADTAEDDTVGKAVEIVNTNNVKVISGLHTIACRPKSKFASGYLGYYMNSNAYHNQLRPYMQGIKVTSISKSNIALTNISIPSLPEQRKIASLFAELDNLIQSAEKELEGYRELKQGMLQKMFPKNGEKVPEIRFPEFTGDWEQRKLGDIFKEYSEKHHEELPALTIIQGGGTILREKSDRNLQYDKSNLSGYKMVKKDDFIVHLRSFEGGLEKANSDGIISPAYHTLHGENVDPRFYYPYFRSYEFINKKLVAHVYGIRDGRSIDVDGMKTIKIPYTSYEEQKKIGDYLDTIDNLIALQQKELDRYKKLKKGLLQQMFC